MPLMRPEGGKHLRPILLTRSGRGDGKHLYSQRARSDGRRWTERLLPAAHKELTPRSRCIRMQMNEPHRRVQQKVRLPPVWTGNIRMLTVFSRRRSHHIPIFFSAGVSSWKPSSVRFFNLRLDPPNEISPCRGTNQPSVSEKSYFPWIRDWPWCTSPPPSRFPSMRCAWASELLSVVLLWVCGGDMYHDSCTVEHTHMPSPCKHTHTRMHTDAVTHTHTHVMTCLYETEPQRDTITHSQQVSGSCLFVGLLSRLRPHVTQEYNLLNVCVCVGVVCHLYWYIYTCELLYWTSVSHW